MIEWLETYSTGVVKLDDQHKNLFMYSNELEEGINRGVVSKQTVEGALRFLSRYAIEHFGQEETCMYKYACPVADINKLAHQEFIQVYTTLQKRISEDEDSETILKGLHYYLENWLKEHICKIDSQLKGCV